MPLDKKFSTLLLDWYRVNKRMLPWRMDQNPYHVWISEVMLQQTRIEAVIPYYERFMVRLPDISSLAEVDEDELLKLWEGLGYYNRARNLKKAAQIIQTTYHGVFPSTYEEILKLPGIGEYTASAIASICFQEKEPTVDGNVLRVYTRLREDERNIDLALTKKEIRIEIKHLMMNDAGDFNEAFMELGEVICLPNGDAKCEICPFSSICKSYWHHSWMNYPKRLEKKAKKELDYTVLLFSFEKKWAIRKREDGLLKNMWEFPNILGKMNLHQVKDFLKNHDVAFLSVLKSISYKHVFSHQIWHMQAYEVILSEPLSAFLWVTVEELEAKYAIPGAFQSFLKELRNVENIKK